MLFLGVTLLNDQKEIFYNLEKKNMMKIENGLVRTFSNPCLSVDKWLEDR